MVLAPHTGGITHYRSNKSRLAVVSQTMIAHCVKVGHLESARRSFRRAKRFLPIGKNTYYCVSSLIPP
ncbi:hypothetical protein IJ674_07715 [bacterium]|nr:hypothetical protein [bacterium]